jgi:hypothetical protein
MKIKTAELTGPALDWAVDAVETGDPMRVEYKKDGSGVWMLFDKHNMYAPNGPQKYSTDRNLAGTIVERENISVIRCADEYGKDAKGFTTLERIPVWGAVCGERYSCDAVYGPQGDNWGEQYSIDEDDVVLGPTPLIAAMRAYVAKKLGPEVDVPEELLK